MFGTISLVYYFLTILFGFSSMGISLIVFFKLENNKEVCNYLILFSILTLKISTWLIESYCTILEMSLPSLFYFFSNILIFALFWTIPYVVLSFFKIRHLNIINLLTLSISLLFSVDALLFFFFEISLVSGVFSGLAFSFFFICMLIFVLSISIVRIPKIKRLKTKKIAQTFFILTLSGLPFLIVDFINFGGIPILFTPLYYIIFNSFIIFYSSKYLFLEVERKTKISLAFVEEFQLSKRETEIAALLLTGLSNKEIGDKINVSISTVKTHIYNIYNKTSVKSRIRFNQLVKDYKE